MTAETKLCFECKETKPAAEFYTNIKHKDGLSSRCRACTLADMHRRWRAKHPEPEPWVMPTEKACSRCMQLKPMDQFVRIKNPAKASRDGYSSDCKACRSELANKWNKANKKRRRESARRYAARHPERVKDSHLRDKFDLPHGTYDEMLVAQDGKCAICGTTKPGNRTGRFAVDHCHETGAVRGLLCDRCNLGIGLMEHSDSITHASIEYITGRRRYWKQ